MSERTRAGIQDVLQAARATRLVDGLLGVFEQIELLYGADWIVAYDLQQAKKCIEKEQRHLQEQVGAERADEDGEKESARSASR